jgi:hypothetical protein
VTVTDLAETMAAAPRGPAQMLAPMQLVHAGEPSALIQSLLAAVHRGEITSKVMREIVVRLIPPAKPVVKIRMPKITNGSSYAEACQRIAAAAAAGRITPRDASIMMRVAKAAHESLRAAARARLLLRE